MHAKSILSLNLIFILIIILTACNNQGANNHAADFNQHRLRIITTLFPLYDMAKHIGADRAEVILLLPPGVEAHTFEPNPSAMLQINQADIFVYTGKCMEPWAEDIIKSLDHKKLKVVDVSLGTKMIPAVFHDTDEPTGALDPHIWLDFDNATIMVRNILAAMVAQDPNNKSEYEQHATQYINQLTALDSTFRATLARCKRQEIVYGGHYAFGYLAYRYGLKYIAAQGISPDSEPTAKDIALLIDQIKQDRIRYVFYEELTSPKIAVALARETQTKLLPLNAGHNISKSQFEQGITFFDILNTDLANLKLGLEYQ
ncbi:MAG: metal ABC transporter solute-binding protein, Zn/Mn family [bacterium]